MHALGPLWTVEIFPQTGKVARRLALSKPTADCRCVAIVNEAAQVTGEKGVRRQRLAAGDAYRKMAKLLQPRQSR